MTIDLNPDLAQWFTPDWLADHLIDSVPERHRRGDPARVIEPSAGQGSLILSLMRRIGYSWRAKIVLDAIEVDPRFEGWLNGMRPQDESWSYRVEICDYLERPAPPERYDIAIANPPFTRGMEGPFMAKLLDECNFIAAILPSRSLHGLARYDAIWRRFEPVERDAPEWAIRSIKYLIRRPKFAGTNGGKDEIVIVAMERLDVSGSTLVNPSISWI